jgi:putative FmdB family regulatory protein
VATPSWRIMIVGTLGDRVPTLTARGGTVPTYQYACTACGHRFDAVQSFSDSALTECPECSGKLRKLFGSVGVVFKGSGFYRTDSRNGSTASTPAAASSSESKTESKSETKSESKPAAAKAESSSSTPAKAAAS